MELTHKITRILKKLVLPWYAHVKRMPHNRWHKKIPEVVSKGYKKVVKLGQPALNIYKNTIIEKD